MDTTLKFISKEHAKRIDAIERLIETELRSSEYIGLNVLGNILADDGYRWKDYKEELGIKTMYEWAELFFSDNYVVEMRDTGDWCLRKRTDSDTEKLYPYDSGSVNKEEIEQLNASLEITDKSHMCEVLRDSGNYRGSTDNKWIAYIAHCWGVAGLRSGGNSFTGPDPETGKMYRAIKLHELRHKVNKQQLYLLCEKENETDEKWVLNEHICGYPSSDSLGKIFRDILGISSENSSTADFKKLVQISENLTELYNNENLREALNTAANCLKNGEYYTCSDDSIFTDFKKLSDLWTSAIEYGKKFGINLSDESATLDDFTTAIKSTQDPAARKLWLKEHLEALRDCESFELFSSAIQPDITYLNSDGTEFKDLLEKYRALSELATCSPNDRWAHASQIADKFSVDDFLAFAHVITTDGEHKEIIKNIGDYIKNVSDLAPVNSAEDNLTNQHRDQSRRIPFSLIKSILSREIDTSQKNIVDQIEAEIGPLNKFEEMVVEGQELETLKKYDLSACYSSSDSINIIEERLKKIKTLESGLTPLCAGNRLHQVQGNINQRAETYWLRAYYEKNTNADEKLLKLYGPAAGSHSDVDRPKELFIELFNNTECPAKNKPQYLHYILNLYYNDEQHKEVLNIFNTYPEVIYYSSNIYTIENAARYQYDEEVLSYYKRVVESAHITDDLPDLENNNETLSYCDKVVESAHITIDLPDFEYYKQILNYCKHVKDAHITIDLPDFENVVTKNDYNIQEFLKNLEQDPPPDDPDKERKDIPYDREEYRNDIQYIYDLVQRGLHNYDKASTDFVLADDITRFILLTKDENLSETGRQCAKLLVDEYRWYSLDADDIARQASEYLFPILANDKKTDRSIEIIRFYNAGAYHAKLKTSHVCRKYYLEALHNCANKSKKTADAEAAVDFACSHLRDVVRNNSYEKVKACCEIAEKNNAKALLDTLEEIAEVPFYNSLLALSGYKATDDELSALGFTKEEIERIADVCSQPSLNGQPLEWITKQFHTTIGWRNGLTKKLLDHEFAIAQECGRVVSDNMLNLQAQYYSEYGDWSSLHELLSKYENFRNDNPRIYAETLFRLKEHTEYWQNNELLSDYLTDEDGKVFHRIAAFKNDNLNSEENLNLTADYIATHADDILDLANWMWNEGKEEAWETLVPSWFASALTAYEKGYNLNQLKDLLSAGGAISEEKQRDYQEKWLASEHYAAAIFVWHYLGGDACEEAAIKFYNESNSRDEGMVLLFPEKSEAIKLKRAFSILSSTRTNSNDNLIDAENANLISTQLRRDDISPEQQRQLSTLLLKLEQVPTSLFTSIAVFWNKMIAQEGNELSDDMYRQMREFLIQKGSKPIDITAATTLIKIYEKKNFTALAAIAKNYCKNNGVLQLSLLNLVKNTEPHEISQLFRDANAFVTPSDEDTRKVQDLRNGEQNIDINEYAESILRVFCSTPLPISTIERLPLEESALQRLELFILSAQKLGNWRACIDHFHKIVDNVGNPSEKLYSLFKQWLESNSDVDVSYILKCIKDAKDDLKQGWDIKEIFVLICQALRPMYPLTSAPDSKTLRNLSSFVDRYELESEFLSDEELYNSVRQFYFQHLDELCYLLVKLARSGKIRNAGSWLDGNLHYSSTYTKELHKEFFLHMAQMDAVEFSSFIGEPWVQKVLDLLSEEGKLPEHNTLLKNWIWPEMCTESADQTLKERLELAAQVRNSAETLNYLMDFFPTRTLSHLLFFACKTLYSLEAEAYPAGQNDLIRWLYRAENKINTEAFRTHEKDKKKKRNWNRAPHAQYNSTYLAQYEDFLQISAIAKHRGVIKDDTAAVASIALLREYMYQDADQYCKKYIDGHKNFTHYYIALNKSLEEAKERDAKEGPNVTTNHDAIQCIALCRITGSWKEGIRYLVKNNVKLSSHEHVFRQWIYTNLGEAYYLPKDFSNKDVRCQTTGLARGILQFQSEIMDRKTYKTFVSLFDVKGEPCQPIFFFDKEAKAHRDLLYIPLEETAVEPALHEAALKAFEVKPGEDYYDTLQARTRLMVGIQYSEIDLLMKIVKQRFKNASADEMKDVRAYCQAALAVTKEMYKDRPDKLNKHRSRLLPYIIACECLLGIDISEPDWNTVLRAFLLVLTERDLQSDSHAAAVRFLNTLNGIDNNLAEVLRNMYNKIAKGKLKSKDTWNAYMTTDDGQKMCIQEIDPAYLGKIINTLSDRIDNFKEILDLSDQDFQIADQKVYDEPDYFKEIKDSIATASKSFNSLSDVYQPYQTNPSHSNRLRAAIAYLLNCLPSHEHEVADKLRLDIINDYHTSKVSGNEVNIQDVIDSLPDMLGHEYIGNLNNLAKIWRCYSDALKALIVVPANTRSSNEYDDDSSEEYISDFSYICSAVLNYTPNISALQEIRDEVNARNSTNTIWSNFERLLEKDLDRLTAGPKFEITLSDDRAIRTTTSGIYSIFGVVENIGNRSARNVSMRVEFMTEGVRATHTNFKRKHLELWPGGTAPFCINFRTDGTPEKVTVKLTVEGFYGYNACINKNEKGKENPPFTYTLDLATDEKDGYLTFKDTEIFTTNFEYDESTGDVSCPLLVGRTVEMETIRSWYSDDDFARWNNGLIYGFRRTGKTTMLRYIQAYLARKNVRCLYCDLSQLGTSTFDFKSVFINFVKTIASIGSSEKFSKWTDKNNEALIGQDIIEFLIALSDHLGQRLIIQFDEFDRFILENPNDYCLTLDSICNDTDLKKKVHFVFCGNHKMRYPFINNPTANKTGAQFFDRAVKILPIGKVEEDDFKAFVTREQNTTMIIPDETIRHLYDVTGGILWYSATILEKVAKTLNKQNRKTVYPFDVTDGQTIATLCNTDTTGDIVNEFTGNIKDKLLSTLAEASTEFLPAEDLAKETEQEISTVSSEMTNLVKFGYVIEKSGADSYRIASEALRKLFSQKTYTCVFVVADETSSSQKEGKDAIEEAKKATEAEFNFEEVETNE